MRNGCAEVGKVIPFPIHLVRKPEEHTIGYNNMAAVIEEAEDTQALEFYAGVVKELERNLPAGEIGELYGKINDRKKRLTEEAEKAPVNRSEAPVDHEDKETEQQPGVYQYTPEMGDEKPACQMEASLAYYGKHYFVNTPLTLKGRGITEVEAHWVEGCQKAVEHWKCYKVTLRAFEKLKEKYSISIECFLD